MPSKKVKISLLFETSWEVCNKIGGIYTVLSTKAKNLQTLYKDKVIFIGPDVWTPQNPCPVFTESKTLLKKWRENANLPYNIGVRVGRWNVPGRPIAVLVKFDGLYKENNSFFAALWEKYGVDSLHAYGDYGEAAAFSHAAGIVIESIVRFSGLENSNEVIAHFNEWTTGFGLLYLKTVLPEVASIFTTHATSIGRSICGNGKELYRYFRGYNGDIMARELNMEAKHSIEKTAAHNADCFTTVSDITADECEQLLDIRPHVVTPNGFEKNFVPEGDTFVRKRHQARKKLLDTAKALTGAALTDDTFIVATSGRCEYRNKGLDMFIDSINLLAQKQNSRKILAYILVPAWTKEARNDLAQNLSQKKHERLDEPYYTHSVHNPDSDNVMGHMRGVGFRNSVNDNVFLIYVPCYLNGDDGIFCKCYYDLLVGMDATVFPSYYEPWGYTPLESIAFGVPTVTTSLSGFGRWVLSSVKHNDEIDSCGVKVVARTDESYAPSCREIADTLERLTHATATKAAEISRAAMSTSDKAAWDHFITYYIDSFDIALKNAKKRNKQKKQSIEN